MDQNDFNKGYYEINGKDGISFFDDLDSSFVRNWKEDNVNEGLAYQTTGRDMDDGNEKNQAPNMDDVPENTQQAEFDGRSQKLIEVCIQKLIKTDKIKQGRSTETVNLLKILKTEVVNHLKKLKLFKMLQEEEIKALQAFKDEVCSFKNLSTFFQVGKLRQKCIQYICSPEMIKSILLSKTLKYERKLQVIKYIERFRMCTLEPLTQWRQK